MGDTLCGGQARRSARGAPRPRAGLSPPAAGLLVPDRDEVPVDHLGWLGQGLRYSGGDSMRTPSRRSSVQNIVDRHYRGVRQVIKLHRMPAKDLDPLKHTASRLLSVSERLSFVHRTKRDFRMNLTQTRIQLSKVRDVQDPFSERVSLRRDTESGPKAAREDLSGRSRENGARCSTHERASCRIRPSRAEADRHVDGDDRRVHKDRPVCHTLQSCTNRSHSLILRARRRRHSPITHGRIG